MNQHRQKQIEIINDMEQQVSQQSLNFTTISPVEDFENDTRMCLTSVHFPKNEFIEIINSRIISPLKLIEPNIYYYPDSSFHMTIKNVKAINDPPRYSDGDIKSVAKAFDEIIPIHYSFKCYFYRLLLFPNNLALIGTTDVERDELFLDLDRKLQEIGVPDDKKYTNSKYFFMNMTLARFSNVSSLFKEKVFELSNAMNQIEYPIDSVSLITSNAVLKNLHILKTWDLK